jgi:hypothetical protein
MKKHAGDAGHTQSGNLRDKDKVLRHGQTRHYHVEVSHETKRQLDCRAIGRYMHY